MPLDLVIFDCDGVLIDSEIISANMLVSELAKLGVKIDRDYVARNFLGRSYPTVMQQIRREFGLDLPPEFEERYRSQLLSTFETELRVMPGVASVLHRLRTAYCVATSSSPVRAARSLQIAGLSQLLGPRLFTASQVAKGKPAPDLFLFAAAAMGADPARCLVIEDSVNGVRAGLAAGMRVWRFVGGSHLGIDTEPEPEDAQPELRFASFAEFFQLDDEITGRPVDEP